MLNKEISRGGKLEIVLYHFILFPSIHSLPLRLLKFFATSSLLLFPSPFQPGLLYYKARRLILLYPTHKLNTVNKRFKAVGLVYCQLGQDFPVQLDIVLGESVHKVRINYLGRRTRLSEYFRKQRRNQSLATYPVLSSCSVNLLYPQSSELSLLSSSVAVLILQGLLYSVDRNLNT